MAQTFNPKKTLEYTLKVGNFLDLKNNLFGDFCLGYAGMPSKEVFSITLEQDSSAKNLFYPMLQKEICFNAKRFEILSVDAEKIKLKYLGEK